MSWNSSNLWQNPGNEIPWRKEILEVQQNYDNLNWVLVM